MSAYFSREWWIGIAASSTALPVTSEVTVAWPLAWSPAVVCCRTLSAFSASVRWLFSRLSWARWAPELA